MTTLPTTDPGIKVSLRHYLICTAMRGGPPYFDVVEHVAQVEARSKGLDFDELRPWEDWELFLSWEPEG